MFESNVDDSSGTEESLSLEEKIVQIFLTVAFPFLIGFVAWGVIVLAFYQWLIY